MKMCILSVETGTQVELEVKTMAACKPMTINSPHYGFSFGVKSALLLLIATFSIASRWTLEIKIIT